MKSYFARQKALRFAPRMRAALVAAGIGVCAFTAVAATPNRSEKRNRTALETVTLQLPWLPGFQFAGYYVAAAKGFYRDVGLEAIIRAPGPAADPIRPVLLGEAQFGVASVDLLLYRAHGSPVVALAPIFQRSPSVLIVLEESGIHFVEELKGRRVMMDLSGPNLPVRRLLRQAGLSLSQIEAIPHTGDLRELIEGRVDAYDAYLTDEPGRLTREGIPFRMFSPDESRVVWYGDILFTHENELLQRPRRVAAFYEASLRGWRHALQNPEEALQIVAAACGPEADREALAYEASVIRDLVGADLNDIGRQNTDRWKAIAEEMVALGALHPGVAKNTDYRTFVYDPHDVLHEARVSRYRRVILWILVPALAAALLGLGLSRRLLVRRNAELRKSEERYRRLFENTPVLIWLGRVIRNAAGEVEDCEILDANPMVARAAKRPREALVGRRARALWPDRRLDGQTLSRLDEMAAQGRPVPIVAYSDIFQRHFRMLGLPAEPGCFWGIAEDVTAAAHLDLLTRLQVKIATAQIAPDAPEQLGRLLEEGLRPFNGADAGVFYFVDSEGPSPAFRMAHAWGISPALRRAADKIPFDSDRGRAALMEKLLILDPGQREAAPLHSALQREGFCGGVYIPLKHEAEQLGGFVVASRFLPSYSRELIEALEAIGCLMAERIARARAEQSLREREAGFRALADNIRAAVFICLTDGKIVYANAAASRQTGWTPEQLTAFRAKNVFSSEAIRAFESHVAAGFDSWRFEMEGHLLGSGGQTSPAEFIVCAIPWRGDIGVQVIARDISWQRRMEEESARVALWEREQLGRELHDGIAQDIVAASLLFESLRTGGDPDRERRAGQVRESLQRSLQRIRQLMRGLESLDAQEQRLGDALRHLAERIAGTFHVDCRFEEQAHPALGDRGVNNHLFYIAREAIMNAVQHARARRVLLRLTRGAAGGVRLEIENDGMAFDPQAADGRGLGLRIMRYRAERIGAAFSIETPPGRGARVVVELPAG